MTVHLITKPESPDQKALTTLFDHIKLIWQNKERILKTPEFYRIHIPGTGISAMYVGNTRLFLGDLLLLWEKEPWHSQDRYYYHVGGSPLSGMSFCKYWTETGHFDMVKNTPSFGTLAFPAMRIINNVPEDTKIIPAETHRPPASPLSITDLVKKL